MATPMARTLGTTFVGSLLISGCSDGSESPTFDPSDSDAPGFAAECSVDADLIHFGGVARGGIPALTDPPFVPPDDPQTNYLAGEDRVIGLEVEGRALAVPHNILWWHEIVNLDLAPDKQLAVTYCPLTGSSIAFDRDVVDGAEFGVSGLLYMSNLMMHDRRAGESLWPQMMGEAACGHSEGTELEMYPVMETTWDGWQKLHPEAEVVGAGTASAGSQYTRYPYGDYEDLDNDELLFPMDTDDRRALKERVLGVRHKDDSSSSIAFPFLELVSEDGVRVVHEDVGGRDIVVLWDEEVGGGMAFEPRVQGQDLTFEVVDGEILDAETGSQWRVDGRAISGDHEGERLTLVPEAYVAFWFAWAAFEPETRIWKAS